MATAAFKSNSKRSNDKPSPKSNPNKQPENQKQRLRRSLSVSAVSRTTTTTCEEYLNKRENPLYWATGGSPEANSESKVVVLEEDVGQRGRSVVRRNSGCQMENGDGRRGRSVSRPRFPYSTPPPFESEAEQESRTGIAYGGRSGSIPASSSTAKLPVLGVKSFDRRSARPSRHPSVGSSFDSQVSNWEDGISTSSLSEAEEKTIKAVYEQMKSLEGDNSSKDTTSTSEIYETVRSEVRRAIADIQDDLQDAIRRNTSAALVSTEVTDASKLVKPGAVELVLDIRREYAKELEESQERARKLRSDLAIEEHRKQELSRILKETLPESKISGSHRSRGRKSSSERKKMSKRLTDEAMSYFDECVSISAFDSSDFSAAEDPSVNSVTTTMIRGATSSGPNRCIDQQMIHGDLGSSSVVASNCNKLVIDKVVEITNSTESERKSPFSFGHKPTESIELQHDIKNYIKTFEKHKGLEDSASERSRANYNADAYGLLDVNESLLFDKVFFKNRQESGSLHICGGVAVPFLPLAHLL